MPANVVAWNVWWPRARSAHRMFDASMHTVPASVKYLRNTYYHSGYPPAIIPPLRMLIVNPCIPSGIFRFLLKFPNVFSQQQITEDTVPSLGRTI